MSYEGDTMSKHVTAGWAGWLQREPTLAHADDPLDAEALVGRPFVDTVDVTERAKAPPLQVAGAVAR